MMKLLRKDYNTIHSTQDTIKEFSHEINENTFLLCTAEEQTKGRGTKNRMWLSPPKVNIYATYGFWLPASRMRVLGLIPQIAAYSVMSTLKKLQIDKVAVKWVNDVLLDNKKVCGILSEASQLSSGEGFHVYLGIGLNVNMAQELCDSLDQPVTSLQATMGIEYNKEEVLTILTEQIMSNTALLINRGFEGFYQEISQAMAFKNERIFFDTENERCSPRAFHATAIGINQNGALILEPALDVELLATIRAVLNAEDSPENAKQLSVITGRILRGKEILAYQKKIEEKGEENLPVEKLADVSDGPNWKLVGIAALLVGYGLYCAICPGTSEEASDLISAMNPEL